MRLDVLVTARGRLVAGLKAADFTVLDNGVPQQVDYVSFDELPLNVVLTFDASGSMEGRRSDDLRAAGQAILDQLRSDDRAAFVSFSHAVSLGADLTLDRPLVRAAINWGTGGDLVEVQSTAELRAAFVRLLAEYRLRYILGYSPTGVTSGGWHKVEVTVPRRGATVKAREGYQGG